MVNKNLFIIYCVKQGYLDKPIFMWYARGTFGFKVQTSDQTNKYLLRKAHEHDIEK